MAKQSEQAALREWEMKDRHLIASADHRLRRLICDYNSQSLLLFGGELSGEEQEEVIKALANLHEDISKGVNDLVAAMRDHSKRIEALQREIKGG